MKEYSNARSAIQSPRSTDLSWLLDSPYAFSAMNSMPRWTAWREEERNGGKTKVPYNSTSSKSAADDPATWITREAAATVAARLTSIGRKGVGIFLGGTGSLPMGGIDLDSCFDSSSGVIEAWAQEVLARFGSYAEVSPSGTGVKVFFRYSAADLEPLRAIMGTKWGK